MFPRRVLSNVLNLPYRISRNKPKQPCSLPRPACDREGGEPGSKCHVLWAGVERVDNREWSHMPVLPEGNGPVTLRDVWLFAATSVAFIFIMMIIADSDEAARV